MKVEFELVYDHDWEEHQVLVYEDGVLNEDRTYHTDSHDDAIGTMHMMKKEEGG